MAHSLIPYYSFELFVWKVEQVGARKPVKVAIDEDRLKFAKKEEKMGKMLIDVDLFLTHISSNLPGRRRWYREKAMTMASTFSANQRLLLALQKRQSQSA